MQHGSTLYNANISYYAHGAIKQGRKVQAYYYKLCKPITVEQIQEIRKVFPYVTTGQSQSQFAPEQRNPVLIFPSKAELTRKGLLRDC
jgi:hypothetical protein